MNKENRIQYPHFLNNQPCGKDLFAGQSHETIAEQIAQLLQIKDNPHKAIGIDGGWGSGKSNLVKLVDKKLPSNNFSVLTYDAWGYQTDFQRRSILENITAFLIDKKLISKDKWNGRLLQLLSRKRTIGTKVMRGLNPIAKIGAPLALLSPIIIPLFNLIEIVWIKFLLYILLSFTAIGLVIYLQIRDMKKYGQPITFTNFFHELFVSYLDYTYDKSSNKESIEQSIKYETIYDEEPSSRDFRLWMKDIDGELKRHKFILVIDNMDRLPKAKVQELWSVINTLFAEQDYENIIIIVPFDREHIKSAFQSENIKNEQHYGDDFINKTFSIVYRVSPPIMSDWKSYLEEQWQSAFGNKIDESITQIYDLLSGNNTPRDIIAFINKFVTIKQVTQDSIPDRYIALYIFGENKIRANTFEELINPTYLGDIKFLYENDEELSKYIAALYYQIEPDKAIEIVYLDRLRKALDTNSLDDLTLIGKLPTFNNLLENAIAKVTNVSNATLALQNCELDIPVRHWDCLLKKAEKTSTLQQYQKILVKHISKPQNYVNRLVSDFIEAKEFNAIEYYESVSQLTGIRDGVNPYQRIKSKTIEPKEYVEFVAYVGKHYVDYKLACDTKKLDEYLGGLDTEHLEQLQSIPDILTTHNDLPLYKSHLIELIKENPSDISTVNVCITRLKEVSETIENDILNPQQIYQLFVSCGVDEPIYYDLICLRISKFGQFSAQYNSPFSSILISNDADMVKNVGDRLEYYTTIGDLLLNLEKYPTFTLYKEVASYIIKKQLHNISYIDPNKVLHNYDKILSYLDVDSDTFIDYLNGYDVSDLTEQQIYDIPYQFYEDARGINNDLTNKCRDICLSHLLKLSIEEWKDSIYNETKEYQLLFVVGKKQIPNAFDAFKQILIEQANSSDIILSEEKRDKIIELCIEKGHRLVAAFNGVSDVFTSGRTDMTMEKFSYFGVLLLENASLKNKEVLRTIFKSDFLENRSFIHTIIQFKEQMKAIIERADEEAEDFKNKVQSMIDNQYKDDEAFVDFAKYIGITPKMY